MPIYKVQAPDGEVIKLEGPEGASEDEIFAQAQRLYTPKEIKHNTSNLGDIATAFKQGVVGAGKSLTDVFGAENDVSQYLGGVQNKLGQEYSPQRLAEMQNRQKIQEEASKSGSITQEIGAFLGGVAEAPVQALAQGLGSIVPYAGTGVVGGVAKLGAPAIRAINTVVGAAQGAGTIKGTLYDNVKSEMIRSGISPEMATEKAREAQDYLGENFLNIVGGAALGGVGARYGVENLLTPGASKSLNAKILPRMATAAAAEAPLEGLQSGQEQYASNVGLQRQGFDVNPMEGVLGATARDAAIGALTAGVVGAAHRPHVEPLTPPSAPPSPPQNPLAQQGLLALPAPAKEATEIDTSQNPLMNPLGTFTEDQIPKDIVKRINENRKRDGNPPLKEFTIEDLYHAQQNENDNHFVQTLIAAKSGYDNANLPTDQNGNPKPLNFGQIKQVAEQRNIDTGTAGFRDFIRRATGTDNISQLTQPQLWTALNALSQFKPSDTRIILPEGTNVSRFTEKQYQAALKMVNQEIQEHPNKERHPSSLLKIIKDATNLENDSDAAAILDKALKDGELGTRAERTYNVVDENGNTQFAHESREAAQRHIDKLATKGQQAFLRESDFGYITPKNQYEHLPETFNVKEGTFEGAPEEATDIYFGDKPTGESFKSVDEATDRAETLKALRDKTIAQNEKEIAEHQKNIERNQANLDRMVALGESNTPAYTLEQGKINRKIKELQGYIDGLNAQNEKLAEPVSIKAGKKKATTKKGYTVTSPSGQPVTFPTRAQAEKYLLDNMTADELQSLLNSDAFKQGKVSQNLVKKVEAAIADKSAPAGIAIKTAGGTKAEATERLANLGIFTNKVAQEAQELAKILMPALKRYGLEKVGINIVDALEGGNANGAYAQSIISVALNTIAGKNTNPFGVFKHEVVHALKDFGAFTKQEWQALENKAKSEWVQKYLKDVKLEDGTTLYDAYKADGLTESEIIEEAIAEAFKHFTGKNMPAGMIGNIAYRLKQFFEALSNAFKRLGFVTAEDIFSNIEAGKYKGVEAGLGKTKYSKTVGITPADITKAKFYEAELEGLIKNVGARIAGMKSDETLDDVRKAVKKLQQYTAEGLRGKDWYEQSAKAVLEAFNGDKVLAEKFFQIIAITSANTEVSANFTKALNGWTQFAEGRPIKVGTGDENKKVDALLNFGEDWGGRKTNTFYTNLMEAMEGKDTGLSTIDLHMTRMIFGKDAPTDAQYELAENMVRLLASKVGLLPRQVQAASWVTQKAKSMFDLYRQKGWKKDLSDEELRLFTFEKAVGDYSHQIKNKTANLPVTPALQEPSSEIKARTQNVTGEVIPSVQTNMAEVEQIPFAFKEKLTKQIANSDTIENIAHTLGIKSKVRVTVGSGAYAKTVNPNLIVQMINSNPEVAQKDALDMANAMSYVFKQDATPLFRADPKLLGSDQLGYRFKFDTANLTPAQQKKILSIIQGKFGEDAGFTKMRGNELVIINYHGENGKPWLATDEDFQDGLADIAEEISKVSQITDQEVFGAQSEYPTHDWKNEPTGTSLIEGIQSGRPERSDIQGRLDNLSESFVSNVRTIFRESGREPKFSRAISAPDTEAVRKFMNRPEGDSKIVNPDGSPKIMYHGTAQDIEEFVPKQADAIFAAPNPKFADDFTYMSEDYMVRQAFNELTPDEKEKVQLKALENVKNDLKESDYKKIKKEIFDFKGSTYGFIDNEILFAVNKLVADTLPSRRNIIPVYIYSKNPFDYQNEAHLDAVYAKLNEEKNSEGRGFGDVFYLEGLGNGNWNAIEDGRVQKAIKDLGFDGFYITEGGNKNIAVYDSSQVKSAFNKAPSAESKDIRFSRALGSLEPSTFLTSDKNPNAEGNLGFMPTNSPFPKRPIRLQIGTRQDERGKGYGAKHILERALTDVSHRPEVVTKENLEDTILHIESLSKRFNRVYEDRGSFILYDSQSDDAMVVAPMNGFYGVTTMYSNPNVQRRYGNPKWSGRNIQPEIKETAKGRGLSVKANEQGDIVPAAVPTEFKQAKVFTPSQVEEIAEGQPRKTGTLGVKKRLSITAPDTPQFKKWFKGSKIVNKDGSPKLMYHGTLSDFSEFLPKTANAIFVTPDKESANRFATNFKKRKDAQSNVMPVYVKAQNPFDYENPKHIETVVDSLPEKDKYELLAKHNFKFTHKFKESIGKGMWKYIESPAFQKAIQNSGFDGFYVKEANIKNLAVYNSNQIKSAFNQSPTESSDIRLSLAPNAPPAGNLTGLQSQETAGQRLTNTITSVINMFKDPEERIKTRIAFIDPNSGLSKRLENQAIYDSKGTLRADLLARGKAQTINLIRNGLQTGIPVVNSDGSIIIRSDETNNLAQSQVLADGLNDNQYIKDSGLSGRGFVAEVARALRGKEIMEEDKLHNARTGEKRNREKQVTPEQIKWAEQQLKNVPEIQDIFGIWKNVNTGLLNLWESVGLLSKEEANIYRNKKHYVSLAASNEDLESMMERQLGFTASGLKSTAKVHKLEGSESLTRNIWENVDKQYASMLAAAYQNQVRKIAVDQLILADGASIPSKMRNGVAVANPDDPKVNLRYKDPINPLADKKGVVHVIVNNSVDLAAFESFHYELTPLMKFFGGATKALRVGALINPMFWIRQLIRDPIHAALVANSGIVTPFHSAKEFINILSRNSPEAKILAERGVIGQYDSTLDLHSFLEQVGKEKINPNRLDAMLHRAMQIHEASDAATRVAIFKKEKQAGLNKGMSEDEATNFAVMKARESINFMIHGNSKSLNALRQMIPFLSASITSLDTVYRAATGYGLPPAEKAAAQKLFKQRAGLMFGSTIAYAMLMQDDDEYKKLPDYIKDNNWLMKNPVGEGFIKVPVPYEVGFLFKTLPEVAIRGLSGNATGKEILKSYYDGFMHNLPTGGVPVPQAVKPALEVITNYSFFTGNPIESIGESRLPVEMRGRNASESAKFLSQAGLGAIGLSPAKIDALVQGYLAEAGSFTFNMADALVTTVQGKETTSKNLAKQPFFKSFLTDPNSNKAVADFYQIEQTANQVAQEFSTMTKTGLGKEAVEMIQDEDKRKLMSSAPALRRIATSMTAIRKQIESVNNNQSIDPNQRRDMVNSLTAQYNRVAEQGVKLANTLGVR